MHATASSRLPVCYLQSLKGALLLPCTACGACVPAGHPGGMRCTRVVQWVVACRATVPAVRASACPGACPVAAIVAEQWPAERGPFDLRCGCWLCVPTPGSAPTCDAIVQRPSSSVSSPTLPLNLRFVSLRCLDGNPMLRPLQKARARARTRTKARPLPNLLRRSRSQMVLTLLRMASRFAFSTAVRNAGRRRSRGSAAPRAIIFAGSALKSMPGAIALTRATDSRDRQVATRGLGVCFGRVLGARPSSARSVVVGRGHCKAFRLPPKGDP